MEIPAHSHANGRAPGENGGNERPAASLRALGCRIGYARHLLRCGNRSGADVSRALRAVPGLEDFLVQGVNRAALGDRGPVDRVEEVLERWGPRRTDRAISAFERRLFRAAARDASRAAGLRRS